MTEEALEALLPCPFEKYQIWSNPDDEIMMVTDVQHNEFGNYRVQYVTERGELGSFWNDDTPIIANIVQVNTRAALQSPPQDERIEGLSAAIAALSRFDDEDDACNSLSYNDQRILFEAARAYSRSQKNDGVCGWQDIESCPRTGRKEIWIWNKHYSEPQAAFSNTWWQGGFAWQMTPTHWLDCPHKPAPPAAEKGED